MGSSLEAFQAGYRPKPIPTPSATTRAATTTTTERFAVRDSKRAKTGAEPVSLTKL